MGEARRRRLALIKAGKAHEARAHRVAPERLTLIEVLMSSAQAEILKSVYDTKVSKETCPTLNAFLLAVIESGLQQFEQFYLEQNATQPSDIAVQKGEE